MPGRPIVEFHVNIPDDATVSECGCWKATTARFTCPTHGNTFHTWPATTPAAEPAPLDTQWHNTGYTPG